MRSSKHVGVFITPQNTSNHLAKTLPRIGSGNVPQLRLTNVQAVDQAGEGGLGFDPSEADVDDDTPPPTRTAAVAQAASPARTLASPVRPGAVSPVRATPVSPVKKAPTWTPAYPTEDVGKPSPARVPLSAVRKTESPTKAGAQEVVTIPEDDEDDDAAAPARARLQKRRRV